MWARLGGTRCHFDELQVRTPSQPEPKSTVRQQQGKGPGGITGYHVLLAAGAACQSTLQRSPSNIHLIPCGSIHSPAWGVNSQFPLGFAVLGEGRTSTSGAGCSGGSLSWARPVPGRMLKTAVTPLSNSGRKVVYFMLFSPFSPGGPALHLRPSNLIVRCQRPPRAFLYWNR